MSNNFQKNNYVADTMAIVLRLERRKLSTAAKLVFELAEQGQATIYIPSLVFVEILYLSEKRRIECNLDIIKAYSIKFPNVKEQFLDFTIIKATEKIKDIPELHDRIIAGTALALDMPLITNDPIITVSQFVKVIW
jgi:predicted nucleic acid-binding protein